MTATRGFPEVLAQLRSLYTEQVIMANAAPEDHEFHLTPDDERALFDTRPDVVGMPIMQSILLYGTRAALPQIYGISVVWGAKKTALVRKHADPDG